MYIFTFLLLFGFIGVPFSVCLLLASIVRKRPVVQPIVLIFLSLLLFVVGLLLAPAA